VPTEKNKTEQNVALLQQIEVEMVQGTYPEQG
jgi:hypothetical protein